MGQTNTNVTPETEQAAQVIADKVLAQMKANGAMVPQPAQASPIATAAGMATETLGMPDGGYLAERKDWAHYLIHAKHADPYKGAGLELGVLMQAAYAASKRRCSVAEVLAASPSESDASRRGFGLKSLAAMVDSSEQRAKSLASMGVMSGVEFGNGGAWIPVELLPGFVGPLVAGPSVFSAPVREQIIGSMVASLPRLTGTTSAAYLGPSEQPTVSAPSTGSMNWLLKRLGAATVLNQAWLQATGDLGAAAIIRDRLLRDWFLKKNLQALRGTAGQFAPNSLKGMCPSGNSQAFTGTKTTYDDVYQWLMKITGGPADSNVPMDGFFWIISDKFKRALFTLSRTGSINDHPFQREMVELKTLLGYPYIVSNQQPNNLGGSANETEITFFRAPSFWCMTAPVMQLKTSDSAAYNTSDGTTRSAFMSNEVVMVAEGWHDFQTEYVEAVALGTGYTPDFV